MKRGEKIIGKVSETSFPNIGKLDFKEKPIYVKGVIEGQTIGVKITKNRAESAKAELTEVIENSYLERMDKICKNFGECGGCFFQKVDYDDQVKIKENHVKKLLSKYVTEFEPMVKSPKKIEYRNKMELSFGDAEKDGELTLGLHKRRSKYDVLDIDDCILMDEDFRKIRKFTVEFFRKEGISYYHKVTHKGFLRYLLLRKSEYNKEILVDIVTSSQMNYKFDEYLKGLLNLNLKGKIVGIINSITDTKADAIKDTENYILYGRDHVYEKLFDMTFKVSIFSFFQTNTLGAELLYSKIKDYIGEHKDKLVFDLYSGTGTIAQVLAEKAKKVVGVEIISEAVEAANINAELNNLNNCEFMAGDVLKVIDTIKDKPDIIILDPPREGIHNKAIDKIIDYGVENIIYISCKPTSLQRDLEVFTNNGYVVSRVCCVDMFPMTVHVECVALLVKS